MAGKMGSGRTHNSDYRNQVVTFVDVMIPAGWPYNVPGCRYKNQNLLLYTAQLTAFLVLPKIMRIQYGPELDE